MGYFQPQLGKPNLWELGSDQHYTIGKQELNEDRSFIKRSLSDGNILCDSDDSSLASSKVKQTEPPKDHNMGLSESSPEISTGGADISYSGYVSAQLLVFIISSISIKFHVSVLNIPYDSFHT